MAAFDLEAARRIRLRQELEVLLANEEPGCREEIIAVCMRYPRDALDAMPRLRAVLGPGLRRGPWPSPAPGACDGSGDRAREGGDRTCEGAGAELEIEALVDQPQATLWPYRPKREPDELFSSWLWRIARGLGAPPKRFAREVIGSHLVDIDRDISDAAIARLAFLSGQPHDHLLRGTMRPDVAADPGDKRSRVQQRLLRHGDLVLNRSRRGRSVPIVQYCPVCLGGNHAYLRRGWRFSLEVACFKDGCFLLDSCWRCGALLDPLAQTVPSDAFLCIRCSAPLARAPSLHMPDSVHDQDVMYATLFHLAEESRRLVGWGAPDGDYIGFGEGDYVAALSSGDLRGTNPADAAARHDALMLTAYHQLHPPRTRLTPPPAPPRANPGGGATGAAAAKLTQPPVRRCIRGAVQGRRRAGEPLPRSPAG